MKSAQDYLPASFWLMKSEPDVFSFDMLVQKGEEFWDGVRNYQARNFMTNEMKVGHKVLFYHSNAMPLGIAGSCEIIKPAMPDPTAYDSSSSYFDSKSSKEKPIWFGVTVGKPVKFPNFVTLSDMKLVPEISQMLLLRKGQRLSIQPLSPYEFEIIFRLGHKGMIYDSQT